MEGGVTPSLSLLVLSHTHTPHTHTHTRSYAHSHIEYHHMKGKENAENFDFGTSEGGLCLITLSFHRPGSVTDVVSLSSPESWSSDSNLSEWLFHRARGLVDLLSIGWVTLGKLLAFSFLISSPSKMA